MNRSGNLIAWSYVKTITISKPVRTEGAKLKWPPPQRVVQKCFELVETPESSSLFVNES